MKKRISIFGLAVFLSCSRLFADALVAGPFYAGTCVSDATIGVVAWVLPGNAQGTGDAVDATAVLTGNKTEYLKCTNFGATGIPNNTRILGIKLEINDERNGFISHTVSDSEVKLVKGGVIQTTNKAFSLDWSSLSYKTYGGSADMWGDSNISAADLQSSGWGFVIQGYNDGIPGTTAGVDSARFTFYYVYNNSIQWGEPEPKGGIQFIGVDPK